MGFTLNTLRLFCPVKRDIQFEFSKKKRRKTKRKRVVNAFFPSPSALSICRRSTKACPKWSTSPSPRAHRVPQFEPLFRVKTIVRSSPCAEGSTDASAARRNDGRRRFIASTHR
ncbi:hypothetical protein CDAR_585471 [Caerostris darwini]|uniref:Uncharacterized protein n=1 Tax=Caerostris darwini TaxID=1538125 RepID=A0AAV4X1E8_9ARAC|nr:hypothetical protein CDAR_585471 [Caerostris darwini]